VNFFVFKISAFALSSSRQG